MNPTVIDTVTALSKFLDDLGESDGQPPRLYVDLEGNDLSRHGTLSLITMLREPEKDIHLVDVTTLGRDAFTSAGSDGRTLKSVLESEAIVKVFFDIRNDSDALFGLFDIRLAGVEDLQLMELASRPSYRKTVNGLARCIEQDHTINYSERRQWQTVKERGRALFDPQRGGSYAVFDQRPLSKDMMDYCTQDVVFMPHLRDVYRERLCDVWWRRIEAETSVRIRLSWSASFNGKGRHMALGPAGWTNWSPPQADRAVRTLFATPRVRTQVRAPSPPPPHHGWDPERPEEADDLANMVRRVALTNPGEHVDQDSDDGLAAHVGVSSFSYGSSDGDECRDLTACDKECGYCGRCDY